MVWQLNMVWEGTMTTWTEVWKVKVKEVAHTAVTASFTSLKHNTYIGINTTIYGGSDLPFKTLNYCWPTVAIVFVYRSNTIKTFTMSQKCIPNKWHSSELFTQRILKKCIMVSKKILRSTLNINKTDKSITSVSMSVFGFKIHRKHMTDYYRNKMWFCTWLSIWSQST